MTSIKINTEFFWVVFGTQLSQFVFYVPGGTAAYPSSLIMNAIPAIVAGVERIVITVPAINGYLNPIILACANLLGISEIYKIGGAQAVSALALGKIELKKVDKIVGPGNAYVATAKKIIWISGN